MYWFFAVHNLTRFRLRRWRRRRGCRGTGNLCGKREVDARVDVIGIWHRGYNSYWPNNESHEDTVSRRTASCNKKSWAQMQIVLWLTVIKTQYLVPWWRDTTQDMCLFLVELGKQVSLGRCEEGREKCSTKIVFCTEHSISCWTNVVHHHLCEVNIGLNLLQKARNKARKRLGIWKKESLLTLDITLWPLLSVSISLPLKDRSCFGKNEQTQRQKAVPSHSHTTQALFCSTTEHKFFCCCT